MKRHIPQLRGYIARQKIYAFALSDRFVGQNQKLRQLPVENIARKFVYRAPVVGAQHVQYVIVGQLPVAAKSNTPVRDGQRIAGGAFPRDSDGVNRFGRKAFARPDKHVSHKRFQLVYAHQLEIETHTAGQNRLAESCKPP